MVRHVRPTNIAFSSTTTFTTAATQVGLILLLAGASFAYPFTRGGLSRTVRGAPSNRLKSQELDYLSEILRQASTQQQQQEQSTRYGLPEYRPGYMSQYYAQLKPRIDSETLAEILPYLSSAADRDDYSDYDYSSYSDDDGTWYDNAASDPAFEDTTSAEDEALVQLFLDQLSKNKYSVDDLKALEREEQLQEEPENELHALMAKKINKKSNNMPSLGMHATPSGATSAADSSTTGSNTASHSTQQGQKEEALLVPATSMRRPVFSPQPVQIQKQHLPSEQQQQQEAGSSSSDSSSTSSDKASSGCTEGDCSEEDSTTMSPRVQSAYDTLKRYLDQERQLRQSQDEGRRTPQKRFIQDQESLTQQLANLKKHVV